MGRVGRLLIPLGPIAFFVIPHVLWGRPPVSEIPVDAFFDDVTGLVIILAGLVAWDRRPGSRSGPLLVVAGYLWYVGSLYQIVPLDSALQYASFIGQGYYEPILVYVILTFPGGRLEDRVDRLAVAAVGTTLILRSAWRALGAHPGLGVPPEAPPNPLWLVHDEATTILGDQMLFLALGIALLAIAPLALRRRGRIRPGARRPTDPVLFAGAVYAAASGLYAMAEFLHPRLGIDVVPWEGAGWTAHYLLRTLAPLGLLFGSFQLRRGTGAVVKLMADPGGPPDRSRLEQALRRALDDPNLVLLYRAGDGWENAIGRPTMFPVLDGSRTATILEANGRVNGALIHDATLHDDPSLVPTVAATLRLAMDNDRLQLDLREQLDEVRASRARVVEAADAERRRVERDLHDGAQQRLVALAISLRTIRNRLGEGIEESVASELEAASAEVRAAIDEVRELARGLDPAILRQAGLGAALASLAGRSSVPVELEVDVPSGLSARVETAAYFVASEALANIAKHAAASRATLRASRADGQLRLEITDDGAGGADPDGTGLRGLADRIAALDGTFRVLDVPGGGTRVEASIPCAS